MANKYTIKDKILELQAIDEKIESITKLAEKIASNNIKDISISISLPLEGKKENILDEDGSIISETRHYMSMFGIFKPVDPKKETKEKHKFTVEDTVILSILGMFLQSEQAKKDAIVKYLKKLNIT